MDQIESVLGGPSIDGSDGKVPPGNTTTDGDNAVGGHHGLLPIHHIGQDLLGVMEAHRVPGRIGLSRDVGHPELAPVGAQVHKDGILFLASGHNVDAANAGVVLSVVIQGHQVGPGILGLSHCGQELLVVLRIGVIQLQLSGVLGGQDSDLIVILSHLGDGHILEDAAATADAHHIAVTVPQDHSGKAVVGLYGQVDGLPGGHSLVVAVAVAGHAAEGQLLVVDIQAAHIPGIVLDFPGRSSLVAQNGADLIGIDPQAVPLLAHAGGGHQVEVHLGGLGCMDLAVLDQKLAHALRTHIAGGPSIGTHLDDGGIGVLRRNAHIHQITYSGNGIIGHGIDGHLIGGGIVGTGHGFDQVILILRIDDDDPADGGLVGGTEDSHIVNLPGVGGHFIADVEAGIHHLEGNQNALTLGHAVGHIVLGGVVGAAVILVSLIGFLLSVKIAEAGNYGGGTVLSGNVHRHHIVRNVHVEVVLIGHALDLIGKEGLHIYIGVVAGQGQVVHIHWTLGTILGPAGHLEVELLDTLLQLHIYRSVLNALGLVVDQCLDRATASEAAAELLHLEDLGIGINRYHPQDKVTGDGGHTGVVVPHRALSGVVEHPILVDCVEGHHKAHSVIAGLILYDQGVELIHLFILGQNLQLIGAPIQIVGDRARQQVTVPGAVHRVAIGVRSLTIVETGTVGGHHLGPCIGIRGVQIENIDLVAIGSNSLILGVVVLIVHRLQDIGDVDLSQVALTGQNDSVTVEVIFLTEVDSTILSLGLTGQGHSGTGDALVLLDIGQIGSKHAAIELRQIPDAVPLGGIPVVIGQSGIVEGLQLLGGHGTGCGILVELHQVQSQLRVRIFCHQVDGELRGLNADGGIKAPVGISSGHRPLHTIHQVGYLDLNHGIAVHLEDVERVILIEVGDPGFGGDHPQDVRRILALREAGRHGVVHAQSVGGDGSVVLAVVDQSQATIIIVAVELNLHLSVQQRSGAQVLRQQVLLIVEHAVSVNAVLLLKLQQIGGLHASLLAVPGVSDLDVQVHVGGNHIHGVHLDVLEGLGAQLLLQGLGRQGIALFRRDPLKPGLTVLRQNGQVHYIASGNVGQILQRLGVKAPLEVVSALLVLRQHSAVGIMAILALHSHAGALIMGSQIEGGGGVATDRRDIGGIGTRRHIIQRLVLIALSGIGLHEGEGLVSGHTNDIQYHMDVLSTLLTGHIQIHWHAILMVGVLSLSNDHTCLGPGTGRCINGIAGRSVVRCAPEVGVLQQGGVGLADENMLHSGQFRRHSQVQSRHIVRYRNGPGLSLGLLLHSLGRLLLKSLDTTDIGGVISPVVVGSDGPNTQVAEVPAHHEQLQLDCAALASDIEGQVDTRFHSLTQCSVVTQSQLIQDLLDRITLSIHIGLPIGLSGHSARNGGVVGVVVDVFAHREPDRLSIHLGHPHGGVAGDRGDTEGYSGGIPLHQRGVEGYLTIRQVGFGLALRIQRLIAQGGVHCTHLHLGALGLEEYLQGVNLLNTGLIYHPDEDLLAVLQPVHIQQVAVHLTPGHMDSAVGVVVTAITALTVGIGHQEGGHTGHILHRVAIGIPVSGHGLELNGSRRAGFRNGQVVVIQVALLVQNLPDDQVFHQFAH